jgi:hypothetical protein
MSNGLRRWVDPWLSGIRVADVEQDLRRRGWAQQPAPRPQRLTFAEPARTADERCVIYLPSSEQYADYPQRILEVVTQLAEVEDRYAVAVLDDILRAREHAEPNGAARQPATAPSPVAK